MSAPKTADGAEIVVGMTVWWWSACHHGERRLLHHGTVRTLDIERGWFEVADGPPQLARYNAVIEHTDRLWTSESAALTARLAALDAERARVADELAREGGGE